VTIGSPERPLRVAVVGTGPAGFFTAAALLSSEVEVAIDLVDRLPTPFGLVRSGVAPDHQKIKGVIRAYARTAAADNVRYLGNVEIGSDPSVPDLLAAYDAVVLCVGTPLDRKLGIEGEDLANSFPATDFVGWYNGHPHHQDHDFDLSVRTALVVGMGNVAIDCARMLVRSPAELATTDMARPALEALEASSVREVVLLGRRGPGQAAFTPAELRELIGLDGVDVRIDPALLSLTPDCQRWVTDHGDRRVRRNLKLLRQLAEAEPTPGNKVVRLAMLRSPVRLVGDAEGRVRGAEVQVNRLVYDGGRSWPEDTGQREVIEAGLVFRAVGYRGIELPGVPFDHDRGVYPNDRGRVLAEDGPVPRLYVAGWAKRGPRGVIGTNRADAKETVASMVADLPDFPELPRPGLANDAAVDWAAWERLDREEVARGAEQGRVREKMLSVAEMLELIS